MTQVGETTAAEIRAPIGDAPTAERFHTLRTFGRGAVKTAGLLAFGAGAAILSTEVNPVELDIGPHDAEGELTYGSAVVIETGFLGEGVLPLGKTESFGFGANIDIKGANGIRNIEDSLGLYAELDEDVTDARNKLLLRGGRDAALAMLFAGGAWHYRRRFLKADLLQNLGSTRGRVAVGLATVGIVGTACAQNPPSLSADLGGAEPVSQVFDGTPLEGAYVRGDYLKELVNEAGPIVLNYIEENDEFYDELSTNLDRELEEKAVLQSDDEHDIVLFTTDSHCNIGMGELVSRTARHIKPKLMIKGGDTTISGTPAEEICVRNDGNGPKGTEEVAVRGNHDSGVTSEQLADSGDTVLNGEPVELSGYSLLGDESQERSILGQETYQSGPETPEQIGERLADTACAEDVDIVVVHDPVSAAETAARGCANLVLAGHTHEFVFDDSGTPFFVGGSIGGAKGEGATIGPLQQPASELIVSIEKSTGLPDMYQLITFNPDGTVIVGLINHIARNMEDESFALAAG